MSNQPDSKTRVEWSQQEIDTIIDGLEQAGSRMDDDEFREQYGDVYRKLHAIENEGGENEYRVK
jgi:hypothetical protein